MNAAKRSNSEVSANGGPIRNRHKSSGSVVIDVSSFKEQSDENKKNEDEKDDKEKEDKPPPVGAFQLFRYATKKELFLIFVGLTAATLAGLCMPAMVILFGRLTNAFVYNDLDYEALYNSTNLTVDQIKDILDIGDFYDDVKIFSYGTMVIGVLQFLLGYLFVMTLNYAAEGQVFRLRMNFLKSILRQEIGWFDTNQTTDFASRVTEDLNKVQEGMGEKVGMFVFFITTFLFSIINAFVHGWELTLVILSTFPLMAISTAVMTKVQSSMTSQELDEYSNAGSIAEEVLSSIRTVVCFGGEAKEVKRYEENLEIAKNAGIKRGTITGVGMGMVWLIIYGSYALAFWYGTKLILDARPTGPDDIGDEIDFDPADLIVVFFSVLMGAMNVGQSAPYVEAFNVARGAAAVIYKVIERKSEIDPTDERGEKPKDAGGTVEFHKVHFHYPSRPSVKILQGINIKVHQGQTVALVGASGCGKSTCIQLLQRLYDPIDGEVCFGGMDIRSLNIGWLRDQIGVVGQEPVLFGTSIEENIRYGKEGATNNEIIQAAMEANAHDFIMKLPQQYKTHVGERGVQMSGGQKQRIAIARALIKKPKILLLDEATSALDNESEAIVQKALDKVSQGRTTLIVAHRLSTIRNADKIVVLNHGEVVEEGTHHDLMNLEGHYFSLVKAQVSENEEEGYTPRGEPPEKIDSLPRKKSTLIDDSIEEILDEINFQPPVPLSRGSSFRLSRKSFESLRNGSAPKSRIKRQGFGTRIKNKILPSEGEKEKEEEQIPSVSIIEVLKLNSEEWYIIVGGLLMAVVQGCLMPAFAVLFGDVLGTLSTEEGDEYRRQANLYSLLFLGVGIIAAVSIFFQTYLLSLSGERLTMRLRSKAFSSMLEQDMGWFDEEKNSVGALCSRLSGDASAVQGATGSRIATIVQSVTTLVFCLVLSLVYSVKLGSVMIPFIPFLLLSVYLQAKVLTGQSVLETNVMEKASKIAMEAITNIRTVASLHKEMLFVSIYEDALRAPHKSALKMAHVRGVAFGFAQGMIFIAYACVMFYGGYLVDKGDMIYDDVFKVAEAMILGTMMVGQAMAFAPNYNKAKVSADRLFVLFRRKPLIDPSPGVGLRIPPDIKDIELKDVEFVYPTRPSQIVLKGMSIRIHKGQAVALVGSSGCGKSTIINLLERFYNVQSGDVCLNGQNIEALNVGCVRSLFGLVSQEPVLFDRTIGENIAYGDNSREVHSAEVEKVAKLANIHSFVCDLPDGYKTRVGTKGTQLSGGQKQRVAIARALVRNPEVLLLDEATSALDAESETVVQAALDEAQRGRTSIIIAHRLSTIKHADKILFMKSGHVVEEGSHEELMNLKGEYYQLYQLNNTAQ